MKYEKLKKTPEGEELASFVILVGDYEDSLIVKEQIIQKFKSRLMIYIFLV